MSEVDFAETYLREIGVQTPISLSRLGNKANKVDEPVAQSSSKPLDVSEMDLESMAEKAKHCQCCVLAESRQHVVFGQGCHDADLLFIGEAPNSEEDELGKGFTGHVESIFNRMLMAIGLHREQIYSLNILQCLPPNHRDPKQDELDACRVWLDGQLDKVSPKVICVMGRVAAQALLRTDAVLHDLRGTWHSYRGIPVWVSYHPAYLLRSPKAKQKAWDDLLVIQKRLAG